MAVASEETDDMQLEDDNKTSFDKLMDLGDGLNDSNSAANSNSEFTNQGGQYFGNANETEGDGDTLHDSEEENEQEDKSNWEDADKPNNELPSAEECDEEEEQVDDGNSDGNKGVDTDVKSRRQSTNSSVASHNSRRSSFFRKRSASASSNTDGNAKEKRNSSSLLRKLSIGSGIRKQSDASSRDRKTSNASSSSQQLAPRKSSIALPAAIPENKHNTEKAVLAPSLSSLNLSADETGEAGEEENSTPKVDDIDEEETLEDMEEGKNSENANLEQDKEVSNSKNDDENVDELLGGKKEDEGVQEHETPQASKNEATSNLCKVVAKTLTGKEFDLGEVNVEFTTVGELKTLIEQQDPNFQATDLKLTYKADELKDDDESLKSLGFEGEASLRVVRKARGVKAPTAADLGMARPAQTSSGVRLRRVQAKTLAGEIFTMDNLPPNTTVSGLKSMIFTQSSKLPVHEQKLLKAGKELNDSDTIESLNFKENEVVHIVRKLKGASTSTQSNGQSRNQQGTNPGLPFDSDIVTVMVPAGRGPGSKLRIRPPGRGPMLVTVPQGVFEGQSFRVAIPSAANSNRPNSMTNGRPMSMSSQNPQRMSTQRPQNPGMSTPQQRMSMRSQASTGTQQTRYTGGQIMAVACPPDKRPGEKMEVLVPGLGRMRVTIPRNIRPGQTFRFRTPG